MTSRSDFLEDAIEGGMSEKSARAVFRLVESNQDRLVTSDQLEKTEAELRADMEKGFTKLEAKIDTGLAEVRTEIKGLEVRMTRLALGSTGALGILMILLRFMQ